MAIDKQIRITSKNLLIFFVEKNSIMNKNIVVKNPANNPKVFHEPKILSVLLTREPNERTSGTKRRNAWNMNRITEKIAIPTKTFFAFLALPKSIEENNINKKATSIKYTVPISSMTPKKEAPIVEENNPERKTESKIPNPDTKIQDFGIRIFPSLNLATTQNVIEIVSPNTTNNPFEASTGILVNGKKKTGKSIITKNNDKKEILSKIFDNILLYNTTRKRHLTITTLIQNVDNSILYINYLFRIRTS